MLLMSSALTRLQYFLRRFGSLIGPCCLLALNDAGSQLFPASACEFVLRKQLTGVLEILQVFESIDEQVSSSLVIVSRGFGLVQSWKGWRMRRGSSAKVECKIGRRGLRLGGELSIGSVYLLEMQVALSIERKGFLLQKFDDLLTYQGGFATVIKRLLGQFFQHWNKIGTENNRKYFCLKEENERMKKESTKEIKASGRS